MEALTFKGSVMEAILEAKTQKKLFVVYISGKVCDFNLKASIFYTDKLSLLKERMKRSRIS